MKYDLNYLDIGIGDLSGDYLVNIYDAILLIDLLFEEQYENLGDLNQDSNKDITDIVIMVQDILSGSNSCED